MATLVAGYFHAGVWAVCLLYASALLVGITRMYVGAHYPRDMLAGAILGSAWGLLGGIIGGYAAQKNGLFATKNLAFALMTGRRAGAMLCMEEMMTNNRSFYRGGINHA